MLFTFVLKHWQMEYIINEKAVCLISSVLDSKPLKAKGYMWERS